MTPPNSDSGDDIPETHNYTEAVGTRLTPKTKRRFDDYKQREELGNSEALRRLVRTGLDATDDGDTLRDRLGLAFGVILLGGVPTATAASGDTAFAFGYVASVAAVVIFEPLLRRLWNRFLNLLP
jgi:hypothetical protein